MGTVHSRHSTMNCLVVLSCVLAVAHGAAVLPFAGLGYGYGGLHSIPGVAKSTIKYETHGFEPVDVATPADAVKIELVTKEHEQEILTPTISYAHAPYYVTPDTTGSPAFLWSPLPRSRRSSCPRSRSPPFPTTASATDIPTVSATATPTPSPWPPRLPRRSEVVLGRTE